MDVPPYAALAAHHAREELAYQVDADGRPVWPPRAGPYAWRVSAGRGTVHSASVVHPRGEDPYNVVLVDVEEGFRMMGRVAGVVDVAIGTAVRVAWADGDPVWEVG